MSGPARNAGTRISGQRPTFDPNGSPSASWQSRAAGGSGNGIARAGLALLLILAVLMTWMHGLSAPWRDHLPGPMSRHRDAIAVAITYAQYGAWEGYASYHSVNRVLREGGLSTQAADLAPLGATHYFDTMTDPDRLQAALDRATSLADPGAEGMFFMQDERGMALFFLAAFVLFGITISSWMTLYLCLVTGAVALFGVTFRRHTALLSVLLAMVLSHHAVMLILPEKPPLDISLIHGNRFLGILGLIPALHLACLLVMRTPLRAGTLLAACAQMLLLLAVVNARTSAAYEVGAILLTGTSVWAWWGLRRLRGPPALPRPMVWPLAVVAAGVALLALHHQTGLNQGFAQAQQGRVFWHNLLTAIHNNPERTTRFAIPPSMPVYDDQVGYRLFQQEIADRGVSPEVYLRGDPNWIYRTSAPEYDFIWNRYDRVLRDVVLRTVENHTDYVLRSLFYHQPRSALVEITQPHFLKWPTLLAPATVILLLCGALLSGRGEGLGKVVPVLGVFTLCAVGPMLVAAVVSLRVVEVFFLLVAGGYLVPSLQVAGAFRLARARRAAGGATSP